MPAPPPPPRFPLQQYVNLLVDFIRTQGGDKVQLTSLGKVPKPHGLQRKLKSVIKQHPAVFTLYEGAVSGGAETVSLVVTPSPPAAVPPQPASPSSQGPPVAATEEHTVIAFGQQLRADDALRARCAKKDAFKAEYAAWKARELTDGRKWRGAAATVLFRLWRFSAAQGARLGVVRIKAVVGQRVYFAAIGAMAALAESVVEQRDVMEKDKFGVRVTPLHVFEGGLIVRRGAAVQRTLVVENASDEMRELAGASFLQRGPGPFSSSFMGEDGALVLTPGGKVTLTLTCRPILSGMCNNVLNLNFGHFGIARFLEVRCGDADAITDLAPTRPYQRRPRRRPPPPTDETEVVEAPPLGSSSFGGAAANTRRAQAGKLPLYRIPGSLRAAVGSGEAGEALEAACEQMKRLLGGVSEAAALAAYKKAFHELLWVEEMQLNDDLREFDLRADDATVLTPRGRLFALEVRGLAENRPSVLKGDVIKANFPGDPGRVFEGRAREIERETVLLEFNNTRFQYVAGQRIEISFVLSRTPLRRFHQGLDGVDRAGTAGAASRLFPEMAHLATAQLHAARSVAAPLRPFDRRINAQQLAAVTAIVEGRARHVPYIIYGPPGTGKTTTVVECVLQCVKRVTGAELRVLVSSPTNTAADVLCKRLSEGGLGSKMDMLRVNAYTRNPNGIDERVLRHSNCAPAERTIEMPPKEELERVRVVVATLTTAAKLCGEGIPRGHFDVIVIDEAGQAQEPEALAAASMLLGQGGQLVLAGDPKQLGPVIHHSLAKEHGLSTSVLERLMERPIYQKHPLPGGFEEYDPRVLTKLLQNFRAHETLLELPNQLFYEGELLCRGDELLLKCCEGWEGLPSQGVPLLFDGIVGKDQQEERSPSWFNVDECHRVLEHVRDLLRAHNGCSVRLTPEDIGVIAPYNKQVQKLKRLFRAEQLEGIKVGSTEMFQGQEKRVIIISTVRSSPDWVGCDVRHNLGFLDNPKRFNVAITRAQALLIVVGNPNVLRLDFHWGSLLKHCVDNSAYRGVPLQPMPGAESDTVATSLAGDMEQLTLDDETPAELEMPHYE